MNNGITIQNCTIQPVFNENIKSRSLVWDVLRLDRIHPQISGNKYFKLKYALLDAKNNQKTGLLTFGGAWSNHLLATAAMAGIQGLHSLGLIRGEEPAVYADTLKDVRSLGMELKFLSRSEYRRLSRAGSLAIEKEFPDYQYIAEGGYGLYGAKGAAEIAELYQSDYYDWIVAACGTGTTIAGLANVAKPSQKILGISVLKNHSALMDDIKALLKENVPANNIFLEDRFHFGGYAKYTPELLAFMEEFYQINSIPTDFVYTGKLMYAVNQLITEGRFAAGSRILTIHSGGLQGNRSLKSGILSF
jgi:1-aminocyclopropane-1-carboxylate deaminase/D-cysteine desulfhydrase-like pyridoxal-dependent ACC family enzyme